MRGLFDTKSARVARATLVRIDGGAGDHLEHLFGLFTDVLHPAVAGYLVAHIAQRHREFGFKQPVALALHEVFKRVPHRRLDQLHIGLIGVHQRNFLFEHQGTAGHRRQNGKAVFGVLHQHGNIGLFAGVHGVQIAQLQLGHATAFFFFDNDVGDVVVVEYFEQVQANARLVVIDVTGGKNSHLARRLGAIHHRRGLGLRGA